MLAILSTITTAAAAQRPLSDFLSRQGHWVVAFDTSGNIVCPSYYGGLGGGFLYVPPVANYVGWGDPNSGIGMSIDYAGLADIALGGILGTTIAGSVTERPTADGRAEVTVVLKVRNALTWAQSGFDYDQGPLVFGARARDVLAGASPALGNCTLQAKFVNDWPGAPLPDLMELLNCRFPDLQGLSMVGQATGKLPGGAPARLEVVQIGLLTVYQTADSNSRVALDAFPAERINITQTGQ